MKSTKLWPAFDIMSTRLEQLQETLTEAALEVESVRQHLELLCDQFERLWVSARARGQQEQQ